MLRAFWDEAVALTPAHATKDERNMPLCGRGDLAALWRGQGLKDVVEEALTIETRVASFDDVCKPFLEKPGPAGACAGGCSALARIRLSSCTRAPGPLCHSNRFATSLVRPT